GAGIGDDLGGVIFTGADDQVENAIAINIAHRHVDASFITWEWDDRAYQPVTIAIIETNLRRAAGCAGNRHGINRDRGYDVDKRHESVVFMVQTMAMRHVKPGIFVEPRKDWQDAGFTYALVAVHRRRRRISIVD